MSTTSTGQEETSRKQGLSAAVMDRVPAWITPNQISLGRIIGCLVVVALEIAGASAMTLAVVAFVVGSSDFLDGMLARHRGQETKLGAFLDPLGDKLFFLAMLWVLWQRGWVENYILVIILIMESHGLWFPLLCMARRRFQGRPLWPPPQVKPNRWGKFKMGWLGYALGIIILGKACQAHWLYLFAWYNIWVGLGLGAVAIAIYLWDFAHGEYQ